VLRVLPGPRRDWLADAAWRALTGQEWQVGNDSDRVGLRLTGPHLARARDGELPSEGLVPGALQVPPDGAPVLFLADHPVTGGYPVLAVVVTADLPLAAQLRPGDAVHFRAVR
jgi:allophanate hydrolase subunit 2